MLQHKIQSSLARDFWCAAQWMRKIFDAKLQESTPLTADQAILLMILACDRTAPVSQLMRDVGVGIGTDTNSVVQSLQAQGYIHIQAAVASITPLGEEAVAKIWSVQQEVEDRALSGVMPDEVATVKKVLQKIFENCAQITPFQ